MICWWEDISFAAHLFRLFQLREFTAVVSCGDEAVQSTNRKELAQTLWNKVKEKFVTVL